MRIGVSSYSFKRLLEQGMDYFALCDKAKALGFEGVEFTDLELRFGRGQETVEALAEALRGYCEALELPILAYTVSADFIRGRGGAAADEPARVMRCADIAALLGANVLRYDVIWRLDGERDWRAAAERALDGVRRTADYAQSRGLRACTENHGKILQDSARMAEWINRVGRPNYGWLVDIGNFLCADENPCVAVGVAAPYAVHAHVKDFLFKTGEGERPGGKWLATRGGNYLRGTVVGHGVVPVRACLRALREGGYTGDVSVEFEGAEETLPALEQSLEYLRRVTA